MLWNLVSVMDYFYKTMLLVYSFDNEYLNKVDL